MAAPPEPVRPALVGHHFVKKYYTTLAETPNQVYKFYKAQSVFSRGNEGDTNAVVAVGQGEINDEIMATVGQYEKRACRVLISDVDAQESLQGGVFVLVTGSLTYSTSRVSRRFTQAFFLDKQTSPYPGYFVLNDMLRYLPDN
mmetsp:Transcript_96996/g.274072  ORF Transcript_96996/g.274072 Transcript_96996/m.274072 type:complete len:143 (-) Transcript_96996:110-538(-)